MLTLIVIGLILKYYPESFISQQIYKLRDVMMGHLVKYESVNNYLATF